LVAFGVRQTASRAASGNRKKTASAVHNRAAMCPAACDDFFSENLLEAQISVK